MSVRWSNIVIDCGDARRVGEFWAAVFQRPLQGPEGNEYWVEPGGDIPDILFIPVPEGKTSKNRVHIDLRTDDVEAEVQRLEGLGARRTDIGQRDVWWVVLSDVEGNEFCVVPERKPQP